MSNDLISREALKEAMRKAKRGHYSAFSDITLQGIYRVIDNAPTVEQKYYERIVAHINPVIEARPQGEWIPVSERLPDNRDWYLGVFREPDTGFIGIPFICDYVGKITKGTTKEGWILRGFTDTDNPHEYYMCLECVAWQPLPESYKEGGSE